MDSRKLLKTLTEMKMARSGGILPIGGYSMIPLLVAGDNVRLEALEHYRIGDIVVCIDRRARLLVHRIIDIQHAENESGYIYITKGDNAVATEYIEEFFCLGRVTEASNKNGKSLKFSDPSEHELQIVEYSKKVNKIYEDTHDPNEAYSSEYNIRIYDMAPDNIKEYVYKAQDYMVQKAREYINGNILPVDDTFVYTRDFYSLLVNHRVVNILSPYFADVSGRFSKMFKLAKAQNLSAARKRIHWSRIITEAFESDNTDNNDNTDNIKYALYKGITVSYEAYGDPLIRECDDIDILILPEDASRAHKLMLKLGFVQAAHDGQRVEDEPLMEYVTHLTPYVIPGTGVTVELHTALYIAEWHTEEILSRRRRMDVGGYEFYALSEEDLYACQLYTTAVDDFGCANMTYEEDPNIFLKLKFRNYIDIMLLVKKFSHISDETIIEMAKRYDILFYIYLSLDYTCKIFGIDDPSERIYRFRANVKGAEDIDECLYVFPVDARSCLLSPFKMKMNGAALIRLRDAYYMSQRWRGRKAMFEAGKYKELKKGDTLEYSTGTGSISFRDEGIAFYINTDVSQSPEFMTVVCKMNEKKYRGPGDYCFEAKFVHCDMEKLNAYEGVLYIDDELPWDRRVKIICDTAETNENKTKLNLKILKKYDCAEPVEIKKIVENIIFKLNDENMQYKYKFMYFSAYLFDIKNGDVQEIHNLTKTDDEHLKILID